MLLSLLQGANFAELAPVSDVVTFPPVIFPPEVALVMFAAEVILLAVSFCANTESSVAKTNMEIIALKNRTKISSCLIKLQCAS
jgi:hypothetical protein